MRLSDVADLGMAVVRDGEFRSLGLLLHQKEQMLVMLYDENYADAISANSSISAVVTRQEFLPRLPARVAVATCEDPQSVFYRIHKYLLAETDFYGRPFAKEISPSARIHTSVFIAEKNVRIGARSCVEAGAVIREGVTIGEDVVVRSGVVLGGEGFEPKTVDGCHIIVPHAGGVRIGNRVEVQANTHIVRAVFNGDTVIGDDTKVDALVHIAHNVVIGQCCEIAAGAIVSGSVTVGDNVWIGPGAIISSEITVGSGAFIAIGSVVAKDVPEGWRVFGVPAHRLPKKPQKRG